METSHSGNLITTDTDQAEVGFTYGYAPNPMMDTVIVEINETTPLLLTRSESEDHINSIQHCSNHMSEPELFGFAQPRHIRKLSRHCTFGGEESAPLTVNYPKQLGDMGNDYSVSYPEILKTISITGFGAVEV